MEGHLEVEPCASVEDRGVHGWIPEGVGGCLGEWRRAGMRRPSRIDCGVGLLFEGIKGWIRGREDVLRGDKGIRRLVWGWRQVVRFWQKNSCR